MCKRNIGVAQELGRSCHLHINYRDGVAVDSKKAGVMEDGSVSYPDSGSPQGGVVSPILSNVFLHYVLDVWFEEEVKPATWRPCFSDSLRRRFRDRVLL